MKRSPVSRALSLSEPANFTCAVCGKAWRAQVWFCVDVGANPELRADAARGALRIFTCPNGHPAGVQVPLCVRLPGEDPEIVFRPSKDLLGERVLEVFKRSLSLWIKHGSDLDEATAAPRACILDPTAEPGDEGYTPQHRLFGAPPRFYAQFLSARRMTVSPDKGDDLALRNASDAWEAIIAHRAFAIAPPWFRQAALAETAASCFRRYTASGEEAAIRRAVMLFRQAVGLTSHNPSRALLANLGVALLSCFQATGNLAELDEAVELLTSTLPQETDFRFAAMRATAANAVAQRWQLMRRAPDGDLLRMLLKGTHEPGLEAVSISLEGEIANAEGDPSQLRKLLTRGRKGLRAARGVPPIDRANLFSAVGRIGLMCFRLTHDPAELAKAIDASTKAVELVEASIERSKRNPNAELVEAAIRSGTLPIYLNNLADMLHYRYQLQGNLSDIEAASRHIRRALALEPIASVRPAALNTWGSIAREFYARDKDTDWLKQAFLAFEAAWNQTPMDSSERPRYETNLGLMLAQLYGRTKDRPTLDAAIDHLSSAVRSAPADWPDRIDLLVNLSASLRCRYVESGSDEDGNRAIATLEKIDAASVSAADAVVIRVNLAQAYAARLEKTDGTDASSVTAAFRAARTDALTRFPAAALSLAQTWGGWALRRSAWSEAAEAFDVGLQAIDRLDVEQVDRFARESWFADAQSLGIGASYALGRCGAIRPAVLAFESTRVRLLAEHLEMRDPQLAGLAAAGKAELLDRYLLASNKVARRGQAERVVELAGSQVLGKRFWRASRGLSNTPDRSADRLIGAFDQLKSDEMQALRNCIAEIRNVPGFERFLARTDWDHIDSVWRTPAGVQAPLALVYIALSSAGGVAFIVTTSGEAALELPGADEEWLEKKVLGGGYLTAQPDEAPSLDAIAATLEEVGKIVVAPIASHLRSLPRYSAPDPETVVLVVGGALAAVPLHACPFSFNGSRRTLLDDYVVAHGLSARVWQCARMRLATMSPTRQIVAVGNPLPVPEGFESLDAAETEAQAVTSTFPSSTSLCGREATLEAVDAALENASHAHFACHGRFEPDTPLASHLLLAGGDRLSLAQIAARNLSAMRLVTLSACHSGVTDIARLPEEANGLATSVIEAGVPSSIGALWAIDDRVTPLLMVKLYSQCVKDDVSMQASPAAALREAQLWPRDLTRHELGRWLSGDAPTRERAAATYFVNAGLDKQLLAEEGDRPFEHPFFWAAFANFGA